MEDPGYVARLESADADELARVITSAAGDEEITLREYLGDDRFDHMRELALRSAGVALAAAEQRGNVVVTHGIMGSSLAAKRRIGGFGPIWIDPLELVFGRLDRLRLSEDGSSGYRPEYDVRATGILKLFYGEMILSLRRNWNVYSYWFDWRKELNTSARELEVQIDANFGRDSPCTSSLTRWEVSWSARSSRTTHKGGRRCALSRPFNTTNHQTGRPPYLPPPEWSGFSLALAGGPDLHRTSVLWRSRTFGGARPLGFHPLGPSFSPPRRPRYLVRLPPLLPGSGKPAPRLTNRERGAPAGSSRCRPDR